MISDAAKMVSVESHVLRYWEEELKLPIKRNELGHRFYSAKDVERFCKIKELKNKGLQLKAIKSLMEQEGKAQSKSSLAIFPVQSNNAVAKAKNEDIVSSMSEEVEREEKRKRLQFLLQQFISDALRENRQEICTDIKECVLKEIDYQFRLQDEKADEREKNRLAAEEERYKHFDELLCNRTRRKIKDKRKRHSVS